LEELHTTSFTSFVRTLEQQVRRLSDRIEPPPSELSPVMGITKIMGLLRDVLAATSVAEQRKQDISQVNMFIAILNLKKVCDGVLNFN
jgi:hypothetical protein